MPTQLPQTPLALYLVFHPEADECRALADELHDWFRLKEDDGDSTESGLPLWYRCCLVDDCVSPPIPWSGSRIAAVVFLVDDKMVADTSWRSALKSLLSEGDTACDGHQRTIVFPVAIDTSAFRLGFLFGDRNRLPSGAAWAKPDAPSQADMDSQQPEETGDLDRETKEERRRAKEEERFRIHQRARVIRRALTEAVTRELRKEGPRSAVPEPIDVFLSHAKRDGAAIAAQIRDGLADFAQLRPWFDANDLAPGYRWKEPMQKAAKEQTAALISVVTDAYPTRTWCRREVNLARKPQPLKVSVERPEGAGKTLAWTVQPTVAVRSGSEVWSRPMAQLAQVPQLGWPVADGHAETDRLMEAGRIKEVIRDVVDRLLLETLLAEYYRKFASPIATVHASSDRNIALLTWVPDPWSLAHVAGAIRRHHPGTQWTIAHPGHGLRAGEQQELYDLLDAISLGDGDENRFELMSQERLGDSDNVLAPRLRVAVSAGGEFADLCTAGVGPRHINDVLVRVSRRLMESDATLVYGGTLSKYSSNLTQSLIESALGWESSQQQGSVHAESAPARRRLDDPPLVNYSAWPWHRYITTRQEAELTGICGFHHVTREHWTVQATHANLKTDCEHAKCAADSLSLMRQRVTTDTDVRIVFGGKLRDWSGWLPGILEEVVCSLEAGQVPLIVGGFGGCAMAIAEYLRESDAAWPRALERDQFLEMEQFSLLRKAKGASEQADQMLDNAKALLSAYREQLHGSSTNWPFPVGQKVVRRLLDAGSPARTISAVLEALAMIEPKSGEADS